MLAGNCPDPPCSLLVLGGERNGSEDVLDRDAEDVGPGCQHPVVASRSVIQEEILGLPPQLLDIRRSQVRIDQVELLDSVGQAAGKLPSLRSGPRVRWTASAPLIPPPNPRRPPITP